MATQEIGEIVSESSEELKESPVAHVPAENPMKSLHKYHLMCSPLTIITCVILKAALGFDGIVVFKMGAIPVVMLLLLLLLLLCATRYTSAADLQTYLRTVAVVVDDYALLVMINMEYIEIAIIPAIIFLFIGALASKLRGNQSRRRSQCCDETRREPTDQELIKMALVPYLLQLFFLIWTQYRGQQQESIFIFSDFLLFFTSVLCALAVMVRSPPIGVTPGSEEVMQKTCIIMLMITAQTMTAEWLGKDIIFVSMPELIAVLAWLGIRIHRAGAGAGAGLGVIMSSVMSDRSGYFLSLVVGTMALFLSIYPNDDSISQASWLARLFCISTSCSALCHFHICLLHRWPGSTPADSNELIQLLNFSSTISFDTSGILFSTMMMVSMVVSADPWIFLHEATGPLQQHKTIAASLFLFLRIIHIYMWIRGKFARKREPPSRVTLPPIMRSRGLGRSSGYVGGFNDWSSDLSGHHSYMA